MLTQFILGKFGVGYQLYVTVFTMIIEINIVWEIEIYVRQYGFSILTSLLHIF